MTIFVFDGSFDGLLTAVFDAYSWRCFPDMLVREGEVLPMFYDECRDVVTDEAKSSRVWRGLEKKLSRSALSAVVASFLCEIPEYDTVLFRYIRKAIDSPVSIETDFSDADVVEMTRMVRRVNGEAHRVKQFVRFQKAADGSYFAVIEPLYNVLAIAMPHFVDRFSSMSFLLYDKRRGFGCYYDGKETRQVTLPEELPHIATGRLPVEMMDDDELLLQDMWRTYFKAIAIKERSNPRKQRQDMPVRFWKYLTEKQ
ncbi:MAG: TIGR03915 family putative DNA repair protein [Muribaculum sp.]|nr:TIGR03915 family putative DNA repair protein [Muribaculum sp.]